MLSILGSVDFTVVKFKQLLFMWRNFSKEASLFIVMHMGNLSNPSLKPSLPGRVSYMNSVKMALLSKSSWGSVDRAPTQCLGGHGFDYCRGLDFFFIPHSCHVDHFIFLHFLTELKIHHGLYSFINWNFYCPARNNCIHRPYPNISKIICNNISTAFFAVS